MSADFQIGFRTLLLAMLCVASLLVFLASDSKPKVREVARLTFLASMIAIFLRA